MSLRRHVLRLVVLATAVAVCFSAFAGAASAKKSYTAKQKAQIRKALKKQVKRNPGIIKRKSFLKRAALVNFKLPVTIRLRNQCSPTASPNVATCAAPTNQQSGTNQPANSSSGGTALNQQRDPTAVVNLGPSLGSRTIPLSGALSGEVQFNDSYDGGALGNVKIRIYSDNGTTNTHDHHLTTASVPLLWNPDVTGSDAANTPTRSDAEFAKATFRTGNPLSSPALPLKSFADNAKQGCQDWYSGPNGNKAAAASESLFGGSGAAMGFTGAAAGQYNSLFHGATFNFLLFSGLSSANTTAVGLGAPDQASTFAGLSAAPAGTFTAGWLAAATGGAFGPTWQGIVTTAPFTTNVAPLDSASFYGKGAPGYTVYNAQGGTVSQYSLPIYPGGDDAAGIAAGTYVTGNNNLVGPNVSPFPGAPSYATPSGSYGNAADTVLRTNALSLRIASPGTYVNLADGTGTSNGSDLQTTGQGSQSVIVGASGGEANLFGNIPGKGYGIDVTVSLATRINSIIKIMDQDVFESPSLYVGGRYPAGIFNCRQIWTGAVQNYIPGVRLTGNLRIAPAITKDGKLRIAKATVKTDVNNPQRVALSACLMPFASYNQFQSAGNQAETAGAGSRMVGDNSPLAAPFVIPSVGTVAAAGPTRFNSTIGLAANDNAALPINANERYANGVGAPSQVPCNDNPSTIVKYSSMAPTTVDSLAPAIPGSGYTTTDKGDKATVAGDINVPDLDVDVLIGDV